MHFSPVEEQFHSPVDRDRHGFAQDKAEGNRSELSSTLSSTTPTNGVNGSPAGASRASGADPASPYTPGSSLNRPRAPLEQAKYEEFQFKDTLGQLDQLNSLLPDF